MEMRGVLFVQVLYRVECTRVFRRGLTRPSAVGTYRTPLGTVT